VTCQTIMLPDPITVLESAKLTDAIDLLFRHRIKSLPVVDADGLYRGLFGIHTLVRDLLPRAATLGGDARLGDLAFVHDSLLNYKGRLTERLGEPVIQFADTTLHPLEPEMSLVESLLQLHRYHHNLPVVDPKTGRLLGFVTYWSVLAKLTSRTH
jgi:CBS domain-containing membrane protein